MEADSLTLHYLGLNDSGKPSENFAQGYNKIRLFFRGLFQNRNLAKLFEIQNHQLVVIPDLLGHLEEQGHVELISSAATILCEALSSDAPDDVGIDPEQAVKVSIADAGKKKIHYSFELKHLSSKRSSIGTLETGENFSDKKSFPSIAVVLLERTSELILQGGDLNLKSATLSLTPEYMVNGLPFRLAKITVEILQEGKNARKIEVIGKMMGENN